MHSLHDWSGLDTGWQAPGLVGEAVVRLSEHWMTAGDPRNRSSPPSQSDSVQPEAANRVPMGSYAAVGAGRGSDPAS